MAPAQWWQAADRSGSSDGAAKRVHALVFESIEKKRPPKWRPLPERQETDALRPLSPRIEAPARLANDAAHILRIDKFSERGLLFPG
jgi:hypothetical protein